MGKFASSFLAIGEISGLSISESLTYFYFLEKGRGAYRLILALLLAKWDIYCNFIVGYVDFYNSTFGEDYFTMDGLYVPSSNPDI